MASTDITAAEEEFIKQATKKRQNRKNQRNFRSRKKIFNMKLEEKCQDYINELAELTNEYQLLSEHQTTEINELKRQLQVAKSKLTPQSHVTRRLRSNNNQENSLPRGVSRVLRVINTDFAQCCIAYATSGEVKFDRIDNLTDDSAGRLQSPILGPHSVGPALSIWSRLYTIIQRHFKDQWYDATLYDARILKSYRHEDKMVNAQGHHIDFCDPSCASFYSGIISLQSNTTVCICEGHKTTVVVIPQYGMVYWNGYVPHGGSAHNSQDPNYRLFFKVIKGQTRIAHNENFQVHGFPCAHRNLLRPELRQ